MDDFKINRKNDFSNPIRVAVLSDTHGLLRENVKEVLHTCSYIIHAGDVDNQSIVRELASITTLYLVRGNNDGYWAECYPKTLTFSIGGIRFFLVHDRRNIPRPWPKDGVIIFGHTHKYLCENRDGVLWLNPGSCGRPRFGGDVTMAVMTIRNQKYSIEKFCFS